MQKSMELYCVYDKVAEEYGPVFEQSNDGCAIRTMRKQFIKENEIEKDFVLIHLGTHDKKDGKINSEEPTILNWIPKSEETL